MVYRRFNTVRTRRISSPESGTRKNYDSQTKRRPTSWGRGLRGGKEVGTKGVPSGINTTIPFVMVKIVTVFV